MHNRDPRYCRWHHIEPGVSKTASSSGSRGPRTPRLRTDTDARVPASKGLSPKDSSVPTANPEDQDEVQQATIIESDSDEFDVPIADRKGKSVPVPVIHGPDKSDPEDLGGQLPNPDSKLRRKQTADTGTGDEPADPSLRAREAGGSSNQER